MEGGERPETRAIAQSLTPTEPAMSLSEVRRGGGAVDNPETRAIAQTLTQIEGGISLSEAHYRLERLLGAEYVRHVESWANLLESVQCHPGESPLMSVDEAFKNYGQNDGRNAAEDAGNKLRKIQARFC